MEIKQIKVIVDSVVNKIDEYCSIPPINQYATNYDLDFAFKQRPSQKVGKVIATFVVNGKTLPARVMYVSGRAENSDVFWTYRLTQYDTQTYAEEIEITITVFDENDNRIGSCTINPKMIRQQFGRITPVDLNSDSSLDSLIIAMNKNNVSADEEILINKTLVNPQINTIKNGDAYINLPTTDGRLVLLSEVPVSSLDLSDGEQLARKDEVPTNYVPSERKVNGYDLTKDVILSSTDLSDGNQLVRTSRTINGKALTADISLSSTDLSDGGELAKKSEVSENYVPNTRTINGKPLVANIVLSSTDLSDANSIPLMTIEGKNLYITLHK